MDRKKCAFVLSYSYNTEEKNGGKSQKTQKILHKDTCEQQYILGYVAQKLENYGMCETFGSKRKNQTMRKGRRGMLNKRQEKIVAYLSEENFAKAERLAARFEVSNETIRRDLLLLESEGYIKRTHGGAEFDNLRAQEKQYETRTQRNFEEKKALARLAADFIKDGDTLAMNTGTSTLELARLLAKKNHLTIITNSLDIAVTIGKNPTHNVYIPGGHLRMEGRGLSGAMCCEDLKRFRVDTAILSVGGVNPQEGVTEYHVEESSVVREMTAIANKTMVLADYSKFREVALNKICDIKEIDYIFTDWRAPVKEISLCRGQGVKVFVAEKKRLV